MKGKRSLGQNFLVNRGVRDRIVEALAPSASDTVVEVGPGHGALTENLLSRGVRLVAIELDRELASALAARMRPAERLAVHVADAARFDYATVPRPEGRPLLVVGNLPFNAGAAILRRLLEFPALVARMVLMFQKEVAERLAARPGSAAYGLLSVVTQQRALVARCFTVSAGSFSPRPRVAAAVVRVVPRGDAPGEDLLRVHDTLVRAAFSHRRKTLGNALKAEPRWSPAQLEMAWEAAQADPSQRAEEISVDQFRRAAEALFAAAGPMDAAPMGGGAA